MIGTIQGIYQMLSVDLVVVCKASVLLAGIYTAYSILMRGGQ